MAKMKTDPVGEPILTEYLDKHSDFSFELQVLREIIDLEFACEHGGTYEDPVTKKPRQFDIRARRDYDRRIYRLAVECKNLRENCPLLVSCVPRRDEEAFLNVVFSFPPSKSSMPPDVLEKLSKIDYNFQAIRCEGRKSLYQSGEPVGKACAQVGVRDNGEIDANDSEVYEKWSQALSSAYDLTLEACTDGPKRTREICVSLVIPILVVPENTLWRVEFDAEGNRTCNPHRVDRCPYFVDRSYYHEIFWGRDEVTMSHLELLTVKGLREFADDLLDYDSKVSQRIAFDFAIKAKPDGTIGLDF